MAQKKLSKKELKEKDKKAKISELGNKLLNESLKDKNLQQEIVNKKQPMRDGDKFYTSPWASKSDKQIAQDILSSRNRSLKGGNATERMKNDTTTMGYKTVEKSRSEKPLLSIDWPNLDAGNERRLKKMYGNIEGQRKIDEENKKRQQSNFDSKYKNVLRNKWEDPMYGLSEKDKQKMMKKKGKK